jgi:hypothetical protein
MNKNVTKLLATAMVVGLIAGGSAMANEHKEAKGKKGAHGKKDGCKGKDKDACKSKDGCKGHDEHKTEAAPADADKKE